MKTIKNCLHGRSENKSFCGLKISKNVSIKTVTIVIFCFPGFSGNRPQHQVHYFSDEQSCSKKDVSLEPLMEGLKLVNNRQ